MEKNKSNTLLLIVVGVLILIVAGFLAVLCINRNPVQKTNNNGGNNNSNNNNNSNQGGIDADEALDLDKVTSLIEEKDGYLTIDKCNCNNVHDETGVDDALCDTYELSKEDALKVIEKLKSNIKYQELDTSILCSKYSFDIYAGDGDEALIFGFASEDLKSILIGYGDNGYAFDYNEDVSSFFESLINK